MFGDTAVVDALTWLRGPVALVGLVGAAVFALLPVLLGFSAAGRFGGSPYLGAAMGAALVAAPGLTADSALPAIHLTPETGWVIAGVDVLAIDYQGTVVPIIAICFVLARLERFFARRTSGSARLLLVPLLTLLTTGLLAFLVLGPALRFVGDAAAQGMEWLYTGAGVLGGALVGAVYSPLVVTGLHQGLIAIELGLLSTGGSFIFPIAAAANVAQAPRRVAVWICAHGGGRVCAPSRPRRPPPRPSGSPSRRCSRDSPSPRAVPDRRGRDRGVGGAPGRMAGRGGDARRGGTARVRLDRARSVGPFLGCLAVSILLSFGGTLAWARWRRRRGRPIDGEDPLRHGDEPAILSPATVDASRWSPSAIRRSPRARSGPRRRWHPRAG